MVRKMNTEIEKVYMSNDLIKAKSNLSLNEIKILRLAIAQIFIKDDDFITYKVNVTELAKVLKIDRHGIYQEIDKITTDLLRELIYIGDANIKGKWKKFQWCSCCEHENGVLTIRLHDNLKPYLLELKKHYTHYMIADIMMLKSVYSIRLYELIKQEMKSREAFADHDVNIYLSIELIRKATNTENKYEQIGHFKDRVIDGAIEEINEKLNYHITCEPVKESRKFVGFNFNIKSKVYAELQNS